MRGVSGVTDAYLSQATNDSIAGSMQNNVAQIATDMAAQSAAQHDAAIAQRLLDADAMNQSYLDKRTGAIDGYLGMSQKTQRDIQSIDARTATSRQQRATQAAQIQQRYNQRTMDFRKDNPVYRAPAPTYQWEDVILNAKETRLRSLGSSLYIDRSVSSQEKEFSTTGQLDKLYYSRVLKHDPVGYVGFGTWGSLEQNIEVHGLAGGLYWKGVGALTTFNSKMSLAAGRHDGLLDTLSAFGSDEVSQLNVKMANDVAKSHLQMISRDFKYDSQGVKGLLSEWQITKYHHEVFRSNDASVRFYGGTLGIGDSQGGLSDTIRRGLGMFYLYPAGDQ
jgi:hypothetical protein